MAIGRISGSMLKSNLTRNGVDLAFETNILYLDVTNSRVGIGTSSPSTALQVNGTTTTTGLVAGGLTYPTTDGSNGQVLTTNGSGILSFTSLNSFAGITFVGDDSSGSTINTAETLKFTGASGITTAVVNDTVTITGPNLSSYLTNSPITVVGDDSTGTTLNTGETIKIAGAGGITTAVSGDVLTITGANQAQGITFVGDDSTGTRISDGETLKIAGTSNITTAVSGDTLTITGSKNININSITSDDSTAIQINDAVNIAGILSLNNNKIINLQDPVANQDAATKKYVDDQVIASGSGTVVSITAGTGLTASPSNPITTTGTISLDFSTVVAQVVGDDSTGTSLSVGETIKIAGGNNISTAVSGDTVTITGSKDINVNSISSTDSTAIQINDAVNVSGTLTSPTVVTNNISSENSTAIEINDGLNVSGTLTANTIQTNELSSTESTAIQVNDSLNASGTITAASFVTHGASGNITGVNNIEVNQISSNDSTAVQVADGMNVSGTLTAPTFVTNDISSNDSTAIQINDGLNVRGNLTATGLVANGITYPTTDGSANQVLVTNGSGVLSFTSLNSFAGITFVGDDSSGSTINTAETLKFTGASGITTAVVNDTVTITGPNLSGYAQKTDKAITIVGDDSTGTDVTIGETFKIAGTSGITTAVSGDTITITGPNLSSYLTNSTITVVGDDSTGTTLNSGETIKIAGTSGITTAVSGDTLTITGPNLSGYLTSVPKIIDINEISSSDSSAIQINDAVNIAGILSVGGNVISNVSDPVANQDAATKNYVDTQLSGVSTSFYVEDGTSTIATIDSGDTLRIIGSGGITTAVSGDTLTITGANQAEGITFFDDASTSTAIPDGGALQITSGAGISTSILGNVITITNTSTQLEIDGGSAYSVYNAISEALIDGGTA